MEGVIACLFFLFLNHMFVLKYVFSYYFRILSLGFLKYFDSKLMFIVYLISFLFNFALLSIFHGFLWAYRMYIFLKGSKEISYGLIKG